MILVSGTVLVSGPGSSVSIATGYGLDGPGIESRWGGQILRTCPDRPWGSLSLLYNGYRFFPPGVKSGRGVTLTPHPLLVPWSRKSRAIPLLALWAVRPVQSLSACTRVTFTSTLLLLQLQLLLLLLIIIIIIIIYARYLFLVALRHICRFTAS